MVFIGCTKCDHYGEHVTNEKQKQSGWVIGYIQLIKVY